MLGLLTKDRLKEILINILDWGCEVSEQTLEDMISASGMTRKEMDELGYDETPNPEFYTTFTAEEEEED